MDESKTVYCGNLADEVTEELLYELFLQVAPLERVNIPPNREGRKYGFVTFKHEVSVNYAIKLLNGIKLFAKNITIRPRNSKNQQKKSSYPSHHESKNNNPMESLGSNQSSEDILNMHNKKKRSNGPNHSPHKNQWEKNNYNDNRRNYNNRDKDRNFDHYDNIRGNHSRKPYDKRHYTQSYAAPYGRRHRDF